ncbi:MAG: MoaD/ThiS family protein [Legionellales bacterium]|nr:MoaD/ThiS family protein [Legionellales bacterium]
MNIFVNEILVETPLVNLAQFLSTREEYGINCAISLNGNIIDKSDLAIINLNENDEICILRAFAGG